MADIRDDVLARARARGGAAGAGGRFHRDSTQRSSLSRMQLSFFRRHSRIAYNMSARVVIDRDPLDLQGAHQLAGKKHEKGEQKLQTYSRNHTIIPSNM